MLSNTGSSPRLGGSTKLLKNINDSDFGEVYGFPVESTWATREECYESCVHRATQSGIYGMKDGARSIMVSGGYEDDEDFGNNIIYTGTGGRKCPVYDHGMPQHHGCTVVHQDFTHPHNKALQENWKSGLEDSEYLKPIPVRVVRGHVLNSKYALVSGDLLGFRYDGLYDVKWAAISIEEGNAGFKVCWYKLVRQPGQPAIPVNPLYV